MKFPGKILLVDDEPHIRKFVGLILRQLGSATVLEAANGQDAVEIYKKEKPDLVLLDVNMPIMDGIAALQAIKQIDPEATAVMLTSLANRQTIEQALELGAANYILKDTPKDEISKALKETIASAFGGVEPV